MAKNLESNVYDYAVVGGGLSGLLVANALQRAGKDVLLLEAGEELGGNCRGVAGLDGRVNLGLKYLPLLSGTHEALDYLEKLANLDLARQELSVQPLIYDSGKLHAFLGFGNNLPEFAEEIDYYAQGTQVVVAHEVFDWIDVLKAQFTGDVGLRSLVTFMEVDQGRVVSLTINGAKKIEVGRVVFCGCPKHLLGLLPTTHGMQPRDRQKLAKSKLWTAVSLDLYHSKLVTQQTNMHIFPGGKDDAGPCLGLFHPPGLDSNGEYQHSQWLTFIPADLTDDGETGGDGVRKIKRLLKRAYPGAFESILKERIAVVDSSHGVSGLQLAGGVRLSKIANLWLASAQVHSAKNIVGSVLQAKLVLEDILQGQEVDSSAEDSEQDGDADL